MIGLDTMNAEFLNSLQINYQLPKNRSHLTQGKEYFKNTICFMYAHN